MGAFSQVWGNSLKVSNPFLCQIAERDRPCKLVTCMLYLAYRYFFDLLRLKLKISYQHVKFSISLWKIKGPGRAGLQVSITIISWMPYSYHNLMIGSSSSWSSSSSSNKLFINFISLFHVVLCFQHPTAKSGMCFMKIECENRKTKHWVNFWLCSVIKNSSSNSFI